MEMSTVKTVAVFIIIFGCFAVLYPKIFHPIMMHMLGSAPKKQTSDDVLNRIPPHLRHGRPMTTPEDTMRNMRTGSHPGLRAAAEMKKQAATSSPGAGKGMMSIVLPMYAVGIVVYLVYTLTKVFGKKEKPPSEDYFSNDPFKDIRYDAERHKYRDKDEDEEEEEAREEEKPKDNKKGLENLLLKADERTITEMEMRQLKDRLLETETQMNRILKAMETVQRQVGQTAEEHMSQQARAAMDELQKAKARASDLSPDMESYDIISGGSSPIEEIGHMDVKMAKSSSEDDVKANAGVRLRQKTSKGKGSPKKSKMADMAESKMADMAESKMADMAERKMADMAERKMAETTEDSPTSESSQLPRRAKKRHAEEEVEEEEEEEEVSEEPDQEEEEEAESDIEEAESSEEGEEEIIDSKEASDEDEHPDLRMRKNLDKSSTEQLRGKTKESKENVCESDASSNSKKD